MAEIQPTINTNHSIENQYKCSRMLIYDINRGYNILLTKYVIARLRSRHSAFPGSATATQIH